MIEKQTLTVRKRHAIVAAAIEEFLEKGYANVSMAALAQRAEVSKRTLYNHFTGKEQLFGAIVEHLLTQHAEMTSLNYDADATLEAQLLEFAHKELALLGSERFINLTRMMMAEFMSSPALAEAALARLNTKTGGLETWLHQAMAEGRLQTADPNYAASQFIGLIKAVAFWPQLMMNQPRPDTQQCQQIAEDTVCMFLARYRA